MFFGIKLLKSSLMDLLRFCCLVFIHSVIVLLIFNNSYFVSAGDIVHDDDLAPMKPGCENDFVLVKVQTWVDGIEDDEFVGVSARFGTNIVSKEKNAYQTRLTHSDPRDCCSQPKNKLAGDVIMVDRGNCKFTTKANVAQDAGASAVLIVNNQKELYKMVCEPNETDLDIHIPAVLLPQEAGASLEKMLMNGSLVGTILCASYWSAWSAREAAIEQDKDASDEFPTTKDAVTGGIVDISTASAVLFVVIASCFLVILYKLTSSWFLEFLVVLFAIGGAEVFRTAKTRYTTARAGPLAARAGGTAARAENREKRLGYAVIKACAVGTFARAAQAEKFCDQVAGQPLVGTVLLGCAFLYDIFWVFVSKKLFHESVMIVVARGDKSGEDGIPMLLKIPCMFDPWAGYSIIGFALFDWLAKKNSELDTFCGQCLLITYVALNLMGDHGQPALLYIVPLTLDFLTLGRKRGDLTILWTRGLPERVRPHIRLQATEEYSQ
ncbi:unnamed protein product [Camellia sinensis]